MNKPNLSLIELNRLMEYKGYDIFPEKQNNGLYKVHLFINDSYKGLGKYEYKDQHEARKQTSVNVYNAF